MKQILIIEDEPDIQEILCAYLRNAGYCPTAASNGLEAIDLFRKNTFHLILLDIMLPKLNGYSICRLIRNESSVPIIMLTALDSEEDQLKGFDYLIDDYITKPFSIPILLKKIAAILRRTDLEETDSHCLLYKNLSLDLDAYQAALNGTTLELTVKEFDLLKELIENQGKVLTRSMLLGRVWNYDFLGDERIVDTHIKNLRKKIKEDYIETVRGVGYCVEKIKPEKI